MSLDELMKRSDRLSDSELELLDFLRYFEPDILSLMFDFAKDFSWKFVIRSSLSRSFVYLSSHAFIATKSSANESWTSYKSKRVILCANERFRKAFRMI